MEFYTFSTPQCLATSAARLPPQKREGLPFCAPAEKENSSIAAIPVGHVA